MSEVSATGTVGNVQAKFAYIHSEKGGVFCPLAVSVDTNECVSDMRNIYTIGDIVHFKAVKQSAKNGCGLRATYMRLSGNSITYQGLNSESSTRQNIVAEVTTVHETLAYANSDELGSIFVPGSAFSNEHGNRLNGYLEPGNVIKVDVTRQSERSGCTWRAVSAEICQIPTHNIGIGRITFLTDTVATVTIYHDNSSQTVRCPILSWQGGCAGSGESLFDVVCFGDEVMVELEESSNGLLVIRWSLSDLGLPSPNPLPSSTIPPSIIQTSSSSTQTVTPIEQIFIKCLPNRVKNDLYDRIPCLHKLIDQIDSL